MKAAAYGCLGLVIAPILLLSGFVVSQGVVRTSEPIAEPVTLNGLTLHLRHWNEPIEKRHDDAWLHDLAYSDKARINGRFSATGKTNVADFQIQVRSTKASAPPAFGRLREKRSRCADFLYRRRLLFRRGLVTRHTSRPDRDQGGRRRRGKSPLFHACVPFQTTDQLQPGLVGSSHGHLTPNRQRLSPAAARSPPPPRAHPASAHGRWRAPSPAPRPSPA